MLPLPFVIAATLACLSNSALASVDEGAQSTTIGEATPPRASVSVPDVIMIQPPRRAIETLAAPETRTLEVLTPSWAAGTDIPVENTQYGANRFPGLRWSAGPPRTKSYTAILQDLDAIRDGVPRVPLHWSIINIPASITSLPADMTSATKPAGSAYGPNYKGEAQPYLGPRPPRGTSHRYSLQVFALDARIATAHITDYDTLLSRLKGHVLAAGEILGLGRSPAAP